MKFIALVVLMVLTSGIQTCCYAVGCNCDDWVKKGGYCVDYIKERIPTFPLPDKDDMPGLKNADIVDVTEGDVAIFRIKNYWHVAYVEKVHRNEFGAATAIDVSEMNFGDKLSFHEFKKKWKTRSRNEWNRALCCGITDNYDRITTRKNIALNTVSQLWSPDDVASQSTGLHRIDAIVDRVREAVNRFWEYTEKDL